MNLFAFNDENFTSLTSEEQIECECDCNKFLYCQDIHSYPSLCRQQHITYLTNGLSKLASSMISLDSSRPWIIYWILHALYLLNAEPTHLYPQIIQTLNSMQCDTGGFGGGPQQLSHCAPTYAAILSLCIIGTKEAYDIIQRDKLYQFFLSMKDKKSNGFHMHKDGEIDVRSMYTILSIAKITNLLTNELINGCEDYLRKCQTYEGGFGGESFNEAHGGYNFCALASLLILNKTQYCDVNSQIHWLVSRQMKYEGGFQGRTNKLVDSCYSFWQGAALSMIEIIQHNGSDVYDMEQYIQQQQQHEDEDEEGGYHVKVKYMNDISDDIDNESNTTLFSQYSLQKYIIHCCQNNDYGGLRDKPGKSRDYYHSCYALSGLSCSQYSYLVKKESKRCLYLYSNELHHKLDKLANLVQPTSVVYNIGLNKLKNALDYFNNNN